MSMCIPFNYIFYNQYKKIVDILKAYDNVVMIIDDEI